MDVESSAAVRRCLHLFSTEDVTSYSVDGFPFLGGGKKVVGGMGEYGCRQLQAYVFPAQDPYEERVWLPFILT